MNLMDRRPAYWRYTVARKALPRKTLALPLVSFAVTCLLSCGKSPSGPDPFVPDFTIASVLFTGDSLGGDASLRVSAVPMLRMSSRGAPYLEVTVTWSPPDCRIDHYTLLRSTEPGIHTGTVPFILVGTTPDTSLADGKDLLWGTEYYYALTAMKPDSSLLYSDEAAIVTPLSPFPTPSVLSSADLYMGRCALTWTECPDRGFSRYTLLRYRYSYSQQGDTLGVFHFPTDTMFLDTILPDYRPRYYQVVTTDVRGLSSESNRLAHDPDGPLPWLMDRKVNLPLGYDHTGPPSFLIATPDGRTLFFDGSIPYPEHSIGLLNSYNAETGIRISREFSNSSLSALAYAPEQDALLLARSNPQVIELRDPYTLDLLQSLNVDFGSWGLFALPSGNRGLVSRNNATYVLDLASLAIVDTKNYTFRDATHIPGYGCYIWGSQCSGGLRRIDPVTLDVVAELPVSLRGLPILSVDGDLCCVGADAVFYRLDPWSLSIRSSIPVPITWGYPAALYEVQGEVYAYLWDGGYTRIHVYRTQDMAHMGKAVFYDPFDDPWISRLLPIPGRNAVWGTYSLASSTRRIGIFRLAP